MGAAMLGEFFDPLHACRRGTANLIIGIYLFHGACRGFVQLEISVDVLIFREKAFVIRLVPNLEIPLFDLILAVTVGDMSEKGFDQHFPFMNVLRYGFVHPPPENVFLLFRHRVGHETQLHERTDIVFQK